MRSQYVIFAVVFSLGILLFFNHGLVAQQPVNGRSDKLDRTVLPFPALPFKGKSERTAADSTPDFPKGIAAPPGAPNILLIMTDDVGFGATNTYGGPIKTPTFDRLAENGLRYNMFHTTALCSPTRAALITGRNHHSVASGVITEFATGYPGYNSLVPKSAGSVGEVLKENGYPRSRRASRLSGRPAQRHEPGSRDACPVRNHGGIPECTTCGLHRGAARGDRHVGHGGIPGQQR